MVIEALCDNNQPDRLGPALDYAAKGFKVLPTHGLINGVCTCGGRANCKKGKHPACPHGVTDATTNVDIIGKWWGAGYWQNVGIATGGSFFVVDIDPRHEGDKTLARLIVEHGDLPLTPKVKTGGGGYHYYFRYPEGVAIRSRAGVAQGIDIRGDKGYVLAPPSNHESGNNYEWIVGLDTPIADAPAWVLALAAESVSQAHIDDEFTLVMGSDRADDFASHPGACSGDLNDEICRLIGNHVNRGDSRKTIEALALAWAKRCDPPIREAEVMSRLRWGETKRRETELISSQEFVRKHGEESESQEIHPPPPHTIQLEHEAKDTVSKDILEAEPSANAFPTLHADALYGLAGEFVKAIASETEADPSGVLLSLLCAFGNAIGKHSYYDMSAGRHHANLFVSLVGDTASAKGQAYSVVQRLFHKAEPSNSEDIAYGLSSGEGLVDRVKDEVEQGKDGVFRMPCSKRLLCVEQEMVKPITAMRREGNTLSAVLRSAWDGQALEVNTRGKSRLRASNAHVSILAHITPEELRKVLTGSVEVVNGFANRFLWAMVRRSNVLPEGGDPSVGDGFAEAMRKALVKAKGIGRVERDAEAKALWKEHYEGLSSAKPGAFGSAVARGHAQTLRLSLIYALLDGSQVIRGDHLRAALAVWKYCEASARLIFTNATAKAEGESGAEALDIRLLNAIVVSPGITRKGLHEATGNKVKADDMALALASLERRGLAHHGQCKPEHGGRPAECWYPGTLDDGDDNDGFTLVMGGEPDSSGGVGDEPLVPANLANELTNSCDGESQAKPELIRSQSLFEGESGDGGSQNSKLAIEETVSPSQVRHESQDYFDKGAQAAPLPVPEPSPDPFANGVALDAASFFALLMETVAGVGDESLPTLLPNPSVASIERRRIIAEAQANVSTNDEEDFALMVRCAELGP